MLIQIEYEENGWKANRIIETPENPKLLQALLRTVKRYSDCGGVTL